MYTSIAPIVGWLLLLGTCLFAWIKGAAPERFGAALLLAGTIAALVIQLTLPVAARTTPTLIGEGILAVGFLVLAIRYAILWLGVAMILQGIQFSLHAFYLVMERPRDFSFALITNLVTVAIIACILIGTFTAWKRSKVAKG